MKKQLVAIAEETYQISQDRKYQDITLPALEDPQVLTESEASTIKPNPKQAQKVQVVNECVIQTVLSQKGKKIVVLNFASARHAGGGFLTGAQAQEEKICRCSDVYCSLIKCKRDFYDYHENLQSKTYSDRMIVSQNFVFRDSEYNFIQEPVKATFITSAAVNMNISGLNKNQAQLAMRGRIRNIMRLVSTLDVDVAVLGAFGCGVFKNDPYFVAKCFQECIAEGHCCPEVLFSIYGRDQNLNAFLSVFK